jgi:DNA-binding transcriptional ArsR family regulator
VKGKTTEKSFMSSLLLDWLMMAAQLPGRSLHVAVALWAVGELQNTRVVALTNITSLRFGLDRNTKYRALAWLEEAGLISVERKAGRAPMATILECRKAP